MAKPRFSHVIGFDDAPFAQGHRGDVMVVGAVFCDRRLEAVLSGKVRRDGANATRVLGERVLQSRFSPHLQAVLLQGITLAGFNVVDIHALNKALGIPVVTVCRHRPDCEAVRSALLNRVAGGKRKWALIEKAGPIEACAGVYVQRAGLSRGEAEALVAEHAVNSALPEPLRTAHIIAGGIVDGESRQRV